MNLLLFEANELADDGIAIARDARRVGHVRRTLRRTVGEKIRVGVIGGHVGSGVIESISSTELSIRVQLYREPPEPSRTALVLAMPRPPVFHRVISAATSMGIKEIHIINCNRVEKSYWTSRQLESSAIRRAAILGLEQAYDTVEPEIRLWRGFKTFIAKGLPPLSQRGGIYVADPSGNPSGKANDAAEKTLVVGPEGGFLDYEVKTFRDAGCQIVSLGNRVLRVETAVPFFLGMLDGRSNASRHEKNN